MNLTVQELTVQIDGILFIDLLKVALGSHQNAPGVCISRWWSSWRRAALVEHGKGDAMVPYLFLFRRSLCQRFPPSCEECLGKF